MGPIDDRSRNKHTQPLGRVLVNEGYGGGCGCGCGCSRRLMWWVGWACILHYLLLMPVVGAVTVVGTGTGTGAGAGVERTGIKRLEKVTAAVVDGKWIFGSRLTTGVCCAGTGTASVVEEGGVFVGGWECVGRGSGGGAAGGGAAGGGGGGS